MAIKSFIVQTQGLYYTIKHYRFVIYIEWAYFVISLGVFDCQSVSLTWTNTPAYYGVLTLQDSTHKVATLPQILD
jgi:hypothetical protein